MKQGLQGVYRSVFICALLDIAKFPLRLGEPVYRLVLIRSLPTSPVR
jgi:hypothetical protein